MRIKTTFDAMPNWCDTAYVVTGDKAQLDSLYNTMRELESTPSTDSSLNSFGVTWLSNLRRDGETVRFATVSAWQEPIEVQQFLESVYPDLKFYFSAEEPDMGHYTTNDERGIYFPERYHVYIEDQMIHEYFQDFESLADYISEVTGVSTLFSLDDCEHALREYCDANGDLSYDLDEFRIVK